MSTDYEKIRHYVIDDFSGGMDMASPRGDIAPNAGRAINDMQVLENGSLAPRHGLIPIAVATPSVYEVSDIYHNWEYLGYTDTRHYYMSSMLAPFLHVVSYVGEMTLMGSYRECTLGDSGTPDYAGDKAFQVWAYPWTTDARFSKAYGSGFVVSPAGPEDPDYNMPVLPNKTTVACRMKNTVDGTDTGDTYDESAYTDVERYYRVAPSFSRKVAKIDGTLSTDAFLFSGIHQSFNGRELFVDGFGGQKLYELDQDSYAVFDELTVTPAVASLWGDAKTSTIVSMCAWKDRLFVLDSTLRVFFSAILDPTTWNELDMLDFSGENVGDAVGLMALSDRLLVATTHAQFAILGLTPDDWFQRRLDCPGVQQHTAYVTKKYLTPATYINRRYEISPPLWCKGAEDTLYFVGDDNVLYYWDGYSARSMMKHVSFSASCTPLALGYHNGKVYWSIMQEYTQNSGSTGYSRLEDNTVHDAYTLVFDITRRTITRMSRAFIAFNIIPASPVGVAPVPRLVGVLASILRNSDNEGTVNMTVNTAAMLDATCVVLIDDSAGAADHDMIYTATVEPDLRIDDSHAHKLSVSREFHVQPVNGVYVSPDIDMGYPDRYKLIKAVTIAVDSCTQEYMMARHRDWMLGTERGSFPYERFWRATGSVLVEAYLDFGSREIARRSEPDYATSDFYEHGPQWTYMGKYTIQTNSGQIERMQSLPATTVDPDGFQIEFSPASGLIRIIPPIFGVVMGRRLRLRLTVDKCVIRSVDIEYALRGTVPPTASTNPDPQVDTPMEVY